MKRIIESGKRKCKKKKKKRKEKKTKKFVPFI